MDSIQVRGIRAYGYLGVLPEEQVLGQWFEVDLILWLDLSKAGNSDRLEDTCDYGNIVITVQKLLQTSHFKLIEAMAELIAQHTLSMYPLQQVQVRLTKLTPPIPNFGGTVTVEILRPLPQSP